MRAPPDGGPAFPVQIPGAERPGMVMPGMTLRDWFAGQALGAIIQITAAGQHTPQTKHGKGVEASIALDAYLMADAMLSARNSTSTKET